MEDDRAEPWVDYSRSRLPRGFSHAVRRDDVAQALRTSGATLDSLSFGSPHNDKRTEWNMIFDVYWVGDGRSREFQPAGAMPRQLLMRWHAITPALRTLIEPAVLDRWLPEACDWAAAARNRGNAWKATDHRWMLVETNGALSNNID